MQTKVSNFTLDAVRQVQKTQYNAINVYYCCTMCARSFEETSQCRQNRKHTHTHAFTTEVHRNEPPLFVVQSILYQIQQYAWAKWSVCAFVRLNSIAKSQLNETFTIDSKIAVFFLTSASLRLNCFYWCLQTFTFPLNFSSNLECMTHFQWAHK